MNIPGIFAIDFDGTCVEHKYPFVGKDVPYATEVLCELVNRGHKLVLFTMRSGVTLEDAVRWFGLHNLPLYGVNKNPDQAMCTSSPKVYAHVYIDDAALGCPLVYPPPIARPYVDWMQVAERVFKQDPAVVAEIFSRCK